MRILLTSIPYWGHVTPMLPLARALNEAGAEVYWATGEPAAGRLHAEGFRACTVAGLTEADRVSPSVLARHPEIAALPSRERPDHLFAKVFGPQRCGPMLADLLAIMADVRPELVIHDITEFAAPIAAAVHGVPSVTHSLGPLFPRTRLERAAAEVAPLWEANGLAPRPFAGIFDELYLDIYPPSLQGQVRPHVPRTQRLRSVPLPSGARTPHPFPDAVGRPLVYVTLGTIFNETEPLRRVVEGVRELDISAVVTAGPDAEPDVLGSQPPNVHVRRFVPQEDLLPHCAAVVSHGGSGTFLGAAAHGLPQVCVPQGADQFLNAEACARAGAGLWVDDAEAASVRDALHRVLREPAFATSARVIQAELAAMPEPAEIAAVLVQRYRNRTGRGSARRRPGARRVAAHHLVADQAAPPAVPGRSHSLRSAGSTR